jgi:hypothetical protein
MTTIVMTYYNRQQQLEKTLESFVQYYPYDFNVIIVDDGSVDDVVLPKLPFKTSVLKMRDKTWMIGDPAWNTGFKEALKTNPDIIIIQNAECCHQGDILGYAKKVTDETYISFGCYSLGPCDKFKTINARHINFDGENAWYNHPVYWPCGYHFCSAITTKNLIKLNGFDERFSFGLGYDDDYLLHQVKCLGLKIEITEDPFVFHQWHYNKPHPEDWQELMDKNRKLFEELSRGNEYRARHLITPDL